MRPFLLVLGFAAASSLPVVGQSSQAGQAPQSIRINCGGPALTDSSGQLWQADSGYNSGVAVTSTSAIAAASVQSVFQTARYTSNKRTPLVYTFPVSAGSYHVSLYFAEADPRFESTGARVFNVKLEGNLVFHNLDVYAAVGANTPLVKSADTVVTDGQLTVEFDNVTQVAEINGIEITQTLSTPQLKLNFVYPDGTPVSGNLNYKIATSSSNMSGSQPLTAGQANCLLVASPQLLGLIGTMNVTLSLVDTAGNVLWQVALTLNPNSISFAAVQSSSLYVVVQKP